MLVKFLDGSEHEVTFEPGANLYGADLNGANLNGANLSGADLTRAYLDGADLRGANLTRAKLYGANLRGADLRGALLTRANLIGADLYGANLTRAGLKRADLSGANLASANLRGADLSGAKHDNTTKWPAFQIPQEGSLIVWKRLRNSLAKLEVSSPRTASLVGRKCRCASAKVLELVPALEHDVDKHTGTVVYRVGEMVTPDSYDPNPLVECTNGIHFFLTREEAEAY